MRKVIPTLFALAVLASSTFASNNHSRDHKQHEGHAETSHHGDPSSAMHHHKGHRKGPIGLPSQPSDAHKTIMVSLTDEMKINFKNTLSEIKSNTIIQFIVTNEGRIPHEFSIGNQEEQIEHATMMRKMSGMVHSDGNTITVAPGKTSSITWHFEGSDTVVFSCNIPGHYEAGMFKKVALTQ